MNRALSLRWLTTTWPAHACPMGPWRAWLPRRAQLDADGLLVLVALVLTLFGVFTDQGSFFVHRDADLFRSLFDVRLVQGPSSLSLDLDIESAAFQPHSELRFKLSRPLACIDESLPRF